MWRVLLIENFLDFIAQVDPFHSRNPKFGGCWAIIWKLTWVVTLFWRGSWVWSLYNPARFSFFSGSTFRIWIFWTSVWGLEFSLNIVLDSFNPRCWIHCIISVSKWRASHCVSTLRLCGLDFRQVLIMVLQNLLLIELKILPVHIGAIFNLPVIFTHIFLGNHILLFDSFSLPCRTRVCWWHIV